MPETAKANIDLTYAFGLEPEDAVNYFRQKGYDISWNWHDTWQDAHARSFTVAKAMKLDILKDIRGAVETALKDGITLADFQKELEPLLRKKGWWGKMTMDSGKSVQLGSPHRLRTIYQTNLQSAYMAGRYKQQMENADHRPYLQYVSVMDARTRPSHGALNGKVFRHDDPFWNTHYPPLAYNCRCRTRALTEAQVAKKGLTVESGEGRMVWENQAINKNEKRPVAGYKDPDTGKTLFTDPGWSSNPGAAALENNLFQKAQAIYDGCTGKSFADGSGFPCSAARRVFSDVLDGLKSSFDKPAFDHFVKNILKDPRYPQNKVVAGYIDLPVYDWLAQYGVNVNTPHVWLDKSRLTHIRHPRAVKNKSRYTIDTDEIYSIPTMLQAPEKTLFDTKDQSVLYFFESAVKGKKNKMVVRVNYGKEAENLIITVDRVSSSDFPKPRYLEME